MRSQLSQEKLGTTHTPTVKHKSKTEVFAYSSYVAKLFLVYSKNGYLEGWNVLVISHSGEFPTFSIPTFVALSAVQRWESNTGSIPWNRLRYFTCAMVVTRCVKNTCKYCLGIPMALNGHSVSYQVLSRSTERTTISWMWTRRTAIVPFKDSPRKTWRNGSHQGNQQEWLTIAHRNSMVKKSNTLKSSLTHVTYDLPL